MKTTKETIAELRARLAQATLGPWNIATDDAGIAVVLADDRDVANASLIAAAVNALPGLLDDVEEGAEVKRMYVAADEENDDLREQIESFELGLISVAEAAGMRPSSDAKDIAAEVTRLRAEVEALRRFVGSIVGLSDELSDDDERPPLEQLTDWDNKDVYRSLARLMTEAARLDALRKEEK